jgi:hypothetical protein
MALIFKRSGIAGGLPYEGMAPSGPFYFLHQATPPTMPPMLGAPSVALNQVPFVHE